MKDFFSQIRKLWNELGLNQRVSLGLAALVVLAAMIGLYVWSGRPQMQLLYGKLSEKDAAEIVAAIQTQNIPYQLAGGGSSIYVPGDQVHKIRMELASKGIPAGDGVGFEIFDRTNFGISDFVQRTNYVRALQGELGRTIAQLKGVHSARVMVSIPESRLLLTENKARPTASVFIDQGNAGLDQNGINSIRFLVANAVEGLKVDDVAVIDSHGHVLSESLKDDPNLGAGSSQIKYRKSLEDYFANKVESMLASVIGPGNAVVRVSADIDNESATRTEEKFDPDVQVVRTETSTDETTVTNESDAPKPTGVSSNVPAASGSPASSAANPAKNSEQARKNKSQQYEINRITTNAVKNPGSITRLTAAVFVQAKAQPRKPEELEALRQMVANALGVKSATTDVSLQESPFEAQPTIAKADVMENVVAHADWIRSGVALVVAAGIFFFFLKMLKNTKPDDFSIDMGNPAGRSRTETEVSVEMLNRLIQEKPANVSASLRGWMASKN